MKKLKISFELDYNFNDIKNDFLEAHFNQWDNDDFSNDAFKPTSQQMKKAIKDEISSWLGAMNLNVSNVKFNQKPTDEIKQLTKQLNKAIYLLSQVEVDNTEYKRNGKIAESNKLLDSIDDFIRSK